MRLSGRVLRLFRIKLRGWFSTQKRDLPWRRSLDPYRVWLSEIMLQQTRVAAVIPYYERFLKRFPTVEAVAAAPEEEVLRMWSGLGYYSRARNLHRAAKEIVARHGGKFPGALEDALALPGIGRYTAAAILSIAYGERLAVLDGNVARVLARLDAVRGDLRDPPRWKRLQDSAEKLLGRASPGDWNQALMELGATVCTPRAPMCLVCPVAEWCRARKLGQIEMIPEKRRTRETVEFHLAAAVFLDPSQRTLLVPPCPREAEPELAPLFSRMWQFPAIEVNCSAKESLSRYLKRNFGAACLRTAKFEELRPVRHGVTYREITITPFRVSVRRLPRRNGAQVAALEEFARFPVSNLTRKIARAAIEGQTKS